MTTLVSGSDLIRFSLHHWDELSYDEKLSASDQAGLFMRRFGFDTDLVGEQFCIPVRLIESLLLIRAASYQSRYEQLLVKVRIGDQLSSLSRAEWLVMDRDCPCHRNNEIWEDFRYSCSIV